MLHKERTEVISSTHSVIKQRADWRVSNFNYVEIPFEKVTRLFNVQLYKAFHIYAWQLSQERQAGQPARCCVRVQRLSEWVSQCETLVTPCWKACQASGPGPSTVRPSSSGPQDALYMSMCCGRRLSDWASTASVTSPSSMRTPTHNTHRLVVDLSINQIISWLKSIRPTVRDRRIY